MLQTHSKFPMYAWEDSCRFRFHSLHKHDHGWHLTENLPTHECLCHMLTMEHIATRQNHVHVGRFRFRSQHTRPCLPWCLVKRVHECLCHMLTMERIETRQNHVHVGRFRFRSQHTRPCLPWYLVQRVHVCQQDRWSKDCTPIATTAMCTSQVDNFYN